MCLSVPVFIFIGIIKHIWIYIRQHLSNGIPAYKYLA